MIGGKQRNHLLNRGTRTKKDGCIWLDKLHRTSRSSGFFVYVSIPLLRVTVLAAKHGRLVRLCATSTTVNAN